MLNTQQHQAKVVSYRSWKELYLLLYTEHAILKKRFTEANREVMELKGRLALAKNEYLHEIDILRTKVGEYRTGIKCCSYAGPSVTGLKQQPTWR